MVRVGESGVGSTSNIGTSGSRTGMVCSSKGTVGSSTGMACSSTGTVGSSTGMVCSSPGISVLTTLVLRSSVSSCSDGESAVSCTALASEGAAGSAQVVVRVGVVSSADVLDSTEISAGLGSGDLL